MHADRREKARSASSRFHARLRSLSNRLHNSRIVDPADFAITMYWTAYLVQFSFLYRFGRAGAETSRIRPHSATVQPVDGRG